MYQGIKAFASYPSYLGGGVNHKFRVSLDNLTRLHQNQTGLMLAQYTELS